MKFTIPHKPLIINTTILVLIVVEFVFIIPPNLKTINEIQTDIEEQYIEVDRQLSLGQTTKNVQEELEKIKPFLEALATVFLKRGDQLNFITTLEATAANHNIEASITLPDIPTSESDKEVFQIPLALTLTGDYIDTVEFLIDLQNLEYYVNIVDLAMNSKSINGSGSKINTNLRANTYWKNQ